VKPKKNFIVVKVNLYQKEMRDVGGVSMQLVPKYTTNFREKNPVVAQVVDGNKFLKKGTFLICHHNFFRDDSPYRIYDDLFSIPVNRQIFCSIDVEGNPHGLYGNVLAERIEETSLLEIPASYKGNLRNQVIAIESKEGILKGEEILICKFGDYEIVYIWNGVEKRVIRCFFEDIYAVIEK
jgi:hypothetical protein